MSKHLLPPYCHPQRELKEVGGVVIHYFSAKNVDKDRDFDMEICRNLFLDLNRIKQEREWYMRAPKWPNGRMHASAHYLIGREGEVWQLVEEKYEAWHAGHSMLDGRSHCNKWTLGIELVGNNTSGFSKPQYQALTALLLVLENRYQFPRKNIVGHDTVRWNAIQAGSDVRYKYDPSGRKDGQGNNMDWYMLGKMMNDQVENPAGVTGIEDLDDIIAADPCSS